MKRICYLFAASICSLFLACKENTPRQASSTDSSAVTLQNITDTRFRMGFVMDDKYLLLAANPDTSYAVGISEISSNGSHHIYSAVKKINEQQVPREYISLLNSNIQVVNNKGETVIAKIISFKLYSGYTPHFGEIQRWDGTLSNEERPYTNRQKTDEIWNTGTRYLVAELKAPKPVAEDEELVLAVPGSAIVSSLLPVLSVTDKAQALGLLSKTPSYDSAGKDYNTITGEKDGVWWKGEDGRETISSFQSKDGGVYTLIAHTGGNPCGGDYYYERFSIWKSTKGALPKLLFLTNGDYTVMAAVDADNDSSPEFIVDNGTGTRLLIGRKGDEWTILYSREIPNLDCGC